MRALENPPQPPEELASSRKKRSVRAPLGWLLSLVLLVAIVWAAPLRKVWASLLLANPLFLLLAMVPVVLNLWFRGIRWALLFRPRYQVSGRAALGPVLVGLGLNAVLPGRTGEIARVVLGARKLGVSLPFALSTVIGERLLDAVTLLAFLGGSLLFLPAAEAPAKIDFMGHSLSSETLHQLTRQIGIGSGLLLGVILSLLVPASQRGVATTLGALPLVGARAKKALGEFGHGLTALRQPAILAQAMSLSLLIWFVLGLTILLVSKAIPGVDLNLPQALALMSVSVAVSAIPSVPGAWGVFEAGILLALALTHVHSEAGSGIAFAFAAHLCQYLPVVILGAFAGLRFRS